MSELVLTSEPLGENMPRWILYENGKNVAAFHDATVIEAAARIIRTEPTPEWTAMKAIADRLRWPFHNRADLLVWNRLRLTEQPWDRLVWVLDRYGSVLIDARGIGDMPERYALEDGERVLHLVARGKVTVAVTLNDAKNWLTTE